MDGQVNAANKAAIIVGEANDTVITDCNSSGQVRASGVLGGSQEPSALPLPRHSKQQACLSAILRGGDLVTVPSVDYGTLSVMESQNNYAKEINADPVQLTATVVPDSAANKNVVWNVKDTDGSSTDVIFVDDKGTLTVNREAKWIQDLNGASGSAEAAVLPAPADPKQSQRRGRRAPGFRITQAGGSDTRMAYGGLNSSCCNFWCIDNWFRI